MHRGCPVLYIGRYAVTGAIVPADPAASRWRCNSCSTLCKIYLHHDGAIAHQWCSEGERTGREDSKCAAGSVAWILQNHQKRGGCDYSRRVVHSATRVPVAKAMSGPRVADLSSGGVTRRDKSPGDLHYGNVSVHPCNRRARRRRKDHDATLC